MIKTIRRHHQRIAKTSLAEENAKHDPILDIPSSPREALPPATTWTSTSTSRTQHRQKPHHQQAMEHWKRRQTQARIRSTSSALEKACKTLQRSIILTIAQNSVRHRTADLWNGRVCDKSQPHTTKTQKEVAVWHFGSLSHLAHLCTPHIEYSHLIR